MNYLKTFVFLFSFFSLLVGSETSIGQVVFEVSIEKREMSKGSYTSYMIDIPHADLETVKKNWIKLIQEETKEKAVVTDHEIYIEGAMAKEVVQKPINIYSFVYEVDSSIRIYSFFEIDSVFFDYSGDETDIVGEKMYNGITNFKRKFATDQYIFAVKEEMELEQGVLKTLQSDLKKLEKENESLHKEIKENEQNISEANDELEMLSADNERLLETISKKRADVAAISDAELKKEAKKELKSLESEKKKVGNKIEKERKDIVEYESAIKSCEADIAKNLELQEEKKNEVQVQEFVIKSVTTKLEGIK